MFTAEKLPCQNYLGSDDPPQAIIRQVGESRMCIYLRDQELAFTTRQGDDTFLEYFDPQKVWYLYEPKKTKIEPEQVALPTTMSASPDVSRYKEFKKNGGGKIYMPLWKKEELCSAGEYLLNKGYVPNNLKKEYTREKIIARYDQFGGIIRHVLPRNFQARRMEGVRQTNSNLERIRTRTNSIGFS